MKKKIILGSTIFLVSISLFVIVLSVKSDFSFPMDKTLKEIINIPSNEKNQDTIKDNNNKNNNTQNSTSDNTIKEDDKKPTDKNKETNSDDNDTSDIPKLPDKDKPIDPPVAPTQEQLNNTKRIGLQNKYGFTLFYGDEIGDYKPKRIDPVRLIDPLKISKVLVSLENELARWPTGIFKDAVNRGMPLKIYLIEKDPTGSFAGIVDKQFMSDIKMTLTNASNFSNVFNHEMMHYLEACISIASYDNGGTFPLWSSMNPSDFVYGITNPAYIFNYLSSPNGAFIESYGQTSEGEDRATIFAIAATRPYAPMGCFEKGKTIRNKAIYIAQEIEKYFPSVRSDTTEIWERFIK